MAIKGTEIIEKSNRLNEVVLHGATLQEKRFFCIYLAKINARDPETRKVRFAISDFQKIMELGRMNIQHLQSVTNNLLTKVYNQPTEEGGYIGFTIFKRCRVFRDKLVGGWYIEIEASDDALPLMFNLKNRYFKYELWNALRCKSANQITMYELLKQHEKQGTFEISIEELRSLFDFRKEHERWDNFRTRVIDACQKALQENTDICFTYRKGKSGRGRAWKTIIFDIFHNDNYLDQFCIEGMGFSSENEEPSGNEENYEYIPDEVEVPEEIPPVQPSPAPAQSTQAIDADRHDPADQKEDPMPLPISKVIDDLDDEEYETEEERTQRLRLARTDICLGFEDAVFDVFTPEQLIELRDLARPNLPEDLVKHHAKYISHADAVQYALADYIRNKINMVRANPRVKNFYKYLKAAVSKNYE